MVKKIGFCKGERIMSQDIYKQCRDCCAKNICPAAAAPGSIMCMIKRMQSGKTHGDEEKQRRCPHCGRVLD